MLSLNTFENITWNQWNVVRVSPFIGVGDGGRGRVCTCPPKIREKYFSGTYYVKFGHFCGQESCKIRTFCWFLIHIFRAKILCPAKVDWAPTPMSLSRFLNMPGPLLAIVHVLVPDDGTDDWAQDLENDGPNRMAGRKKNRRMQMIARPFSSPEIWTFWSVII